MTTELTTVGADASATEIASILEKKRIKRVPVVADGKLIGIVSRADLLRSLASIKAAAPAGAKPDDRSIREAILAELDQQDWGATALLNVMVEDGVVHLWGVIRSPEEHAALKVLVEGVAGVQGVEDHLHEQPTMHSGM